MKWARAKKSDGSEVTGVIVANMLHPRVALGSDQGAGDAIPLDEVTLLAPVVPGKFIGLWNNYKAAAEKNGHAHPEHPLYFFKADTSVCGPGATVGMPGAAGRVVFEGELGIVIGKTCKDVTPQEAGSAIFGYTCVNDFTSVTILNADPSFRQWTRAKSFDGFGAIGPVIETEVDWNDLTVTVFVNDRQRQSYPAADMILSPEQIVSCLSRDMTLNPGDLIACGTSIGAAPVKAGMVVDVVIDGIGKLSVSMAAAPE